MSNSAAAERPVAQPTNDQVDPAPDCTMVIFGAAGDLTKRLLMPSLCNMERAGLLPAKFHLIGVDRVDMTAETLKEQLAEALKEFGPKSESGAFDPTAWNKLSKSIDYVQGDITKPDVYHEIGKRLDAIGKDGKALFYLAIADRFFGTVVQQLGDAKLTHQEDGKLWRRVVIEKPFGHDLGSAKALNKTVLDVLGEDQVFRIDHYLGKETVQNIMVFRFANGIFEPLWNRDHIDHIQITVAETVGVEHRGSFYEKAGALRDMVPNHLFQLLSMTAMEPPNNFSADAVRTEKVKVLEATHLWPEEDGADPTARGQYSAGKVEGKAVDDYRKADDVAADSATETYVAMKLQVDNWRWAGMPFYLRTGKAMTHRVSEVVVQFKTAPFVLFRDTPVDKLNANRMIIHVQPDEGVSMEFGAKVPGPKVKLGKVSMNFHYKDYFEATASTGYETLIYDCMIGDQTLFQRADAVEAGWAVVQPLLNQWAKNPDKGLDFYPAGSAGPENAEELLSRDGRSWRKLGA